jgi:hypothetical protein
VDNIMGMTIVKRMTYRGDTEEEFSNTYWLAQSVPADTNAWDTQRDKFLQSEQQIYPPSVHFVRAVGHNSSDPGAQAVYDYAWPAVSQPVGGFSVTAGESLFAGDQAAVVEWLTDLKSSKGKPIYLRKFIHHGYLATGGGDSLAPDYVSALTTYGGHYLGGGFIGTLRSPNKDAFAGSVKVLPFVTTRTLKRRGKKKLT